MATTRLQLLRDVYGQSPWLDNLKRGYLTSGELVRLRDLGVRGLTSNPTIFQKAIQGSADYDGQFRQLARSSGSVIDNYWAMVTADITGALDVFAPVFDTSYGGDGFVSVEVAPDLAHDTAATIAAGKELWQRIDRPNLMVKVPATIEGIPAIRQLIADGVNVNVTLIFGLDRYAEVIEAYLSGLESRRGPLGSISSVASFFISRVDTEVDRRLVEFASPSALALKGHAAVAQGQLAYRLFRSTFAGPRWRALLERGARLQRPLWASTGTKDPTYPDTLYVDQLIAADTVNTLPEPTLHAFEDHGNLAFGAVAGQETADATWAALAMHGVDMADVAHKLEMEGVSSFQKSFDELVETLTIRAGELRA